MPRTTGLTLQLNNTRMYEREMRNLDRIIADLDKKVDKAADAMDKLDRKYDQSGKSSKKMAQESRRASDGVGRDFRSMERESRRMDSVGDRLERFGTKVSLMISTPAGALKAFAVNEAMQFESAFAGVIKTLDTSGLSANEVTEAYSQMRDEIRALATDINAPVAGIANAHTELSRIAELGGQLGISRDNLMGFTETIGELTLATELTAEASATALAQFANITQGTEFDRLGATIVALGNNSATTEDQILSFGARLAAAGTQAGFTEAEILGLGAAMASVGLNAEAGGTAMTRVLNTLGASVATGNEDLRLFAETAGLTVSEFATLFEDDAAGALSSFISGMHELSRNDQLNLMNALGFGDVRVQDTLSRLAGAPELLAESLSLANTAFAENTALTTEAGQRFETTAAQMNLLRNNINDVAITIGDAMLPGINNMIGRAVPFLQSLNDMSPAMVQLTVSLLGVAAASGPVILALSQFGSVVSTIAGVIFSPAFIAGATLFAVVMNDIQRNGEQVNEAFERLRGSASEFGEAFRTLLDLGGQTLSILGSMAGFGDSIGNSFSPVATVLNGIAGTIETITSQMQVAQGVLATFNFAVGGESFGLTADRQRNQLLNERRGILAELRDLQMGITGSNAESLEHTIEQGDTLWDLARQYGTTVDELMRLNDLDSSILSIGQELIINEGASGVTSEMLDGVEAQLADIDAQINALPTGLQSVFDSFSGTDLFAQIFGTDSGAEARALAIFEDIRLESQDLSSSLGTVKTGMEELFSGDVETGLNTLKTGFSGVVDSVLTIVDLFNNRNASRDDALLSMLPEDDALALSGGSSFAALGETIKTELERVVSGDFSNVGTLLKDNLSSVFNVAIIAVGALMGGPVGIAIGLGKTLISAIETDFLGIGTMLEQSTAYTSIRDGFTNFFNGLFGADGEIVSGFQTAISGMFGGGSGGRDLLADAMPEMDARAMNAESSGFNLFNLFIAGLNPLMNLIDDSAIQGLKDLGEGLVGFVDEVMAADWQGLINAVMPWITTLSSFVGLLLEVAVGVGSVAIGSVFTAIGEALPALGSAISALVDGTGDLLSGDIFGALSSIGEFFMNIGSAALNFNVGFFDGIINAIESLSGVELMSASEALTGMKDAFLDAFNLDVPIQRVLSLIDNVILKVQQARLAWLNNPLNPFPRPDQIADAEADLAETADRIQNRTLALRSQSLLAQQSYFDEIDLGQIIDFTVAGEQITTTLGDALADPAFASTLGATASQLIDDALMTATENNDFDVVSQLVDAASLNGLDIDQQFLDLNELINTEGATDADILALATNITDGLATGISDNAQTVTDEVNTLVDDFQSAITSGFEIESPSEWMKRIGLDLIAGLILGLSDGSIDLQDQLRWHLLQAQLGLTGVDFAYDFSSMGNAINDSISQFWTNDPPPNFFEQMMADAETASANATFSLGNFALDAGRGGINLFDDLMSIGEEPPATMTEQFQTMVDDLIASVDTGDFDLMSLFTASEDGAISISFGEDITEGLVVGLQDGQSSVIDEASNIVTGFQETIEEGFQVNSPSLYMQEIGLNLMEGLMEGMNLGVLGIDPIMARINKQTVSIGTNMITAGMQWQMMTDIMGSAIGKVGTQVMNFIPQVQTLIQLVKGLGAIPVLYVSSSPPAGMSPVPDAGLSSATVADAFATGGRGEAGAIYKVAEPSIGGLELIRSDAGGSYIVSSAGFEAIPPMPFDGTSLIPPAPVPAGSSGRGGETIHYSVENITINVPEGTPEVTPEVIAEGIRQGLRDNPARRETRNDL